MNRNHKIEVNDYVRVNFNNQQFTLCSRARVISTSDEHNPWIFYDVEKETTHYVNEKCTITLLEKATN